MFIACDIHSSELDAIFFIECCFMDFEFDAEWYLSIRASKHHIYSKRLAQRGY